VESQFKNAPTDWNHFIFTGKNPPAEGRQISIAKPSGFCYSMAKILIAQVDRLKVDRLEEQTCMLIIALQSSA
jgi:hypothetical protein